MAAPSSTLDKPAADSREELDSPPAPNREARRAAARSAKRKPATIADLKRKKVRTDTVEIPTYDEDGEEVVMTVRIKAIGSVAYDKLVAANPPNRVQRERGDNWNVDSFAPALISACAIEPKMTVEDATDIYTSDEWSAGEVGALFWACQRICNAGTEVPFTGGV